MHILNLVWADSDIFRTLACLGTLFSHIHKVTDIEAYLPHWDSGILSWHCRLSNVKQYLLFKSGYSFKSFGTFFYFCFKINIQFFFFQDSISIIIIKIIIACHPRQHVTLASTPPMPPTLARHTRKQATHATHISTNSTPFLKLTNFSYSPTALDILLSFLNFLYLT